MKNQLPKRRPFYLVDLIRQLIPAHVGFLSTRTILKSILWCCALLAIESCSKKEEPVIPLVASAGPDGNGEVDQVYTLDGSASTGPVGFTYTWTYNGFIAENLIAFQGKDQAKPTFTPPMNGVYNFHLLIKSPANFVSEDDVTITVSTVITLSGTLTSSITLKDIEPDYTKPDYRVTSDLIIPAGMSLTANTSSTYGITIEIVEPAGIEIQGSATFGGVYFTSPTGWKGILVKGSVQFTGGLSQIGKAGKGTFAGQTESAAVTVASGTLSMANLQFASSTGYDLLLPTVGSHTVTGVYFSASIPVKTDIRNASIFANNYFGANYSYVTLTTPGASTTIGGITFQSSVKYLIDGDYTASGTTNFANNTITMKDGAGILASDININNTVFQSQTTAGWKGLAVTNSGNLQNVQLINAGSSLFNTGSFQSTAKAAIFYTGPTSVLVQSCQIKDSQGYGFYDGSISGYGSIKNTTFSNSVSAAIYTTQSKIQTSLTAANPNTFQMNSGVAPVEVGAPIGLLTSGTWPSLGTGNYYSVTSNIVVNGSILTLSAGASLKFKPGKYIYVTSGKITALGTSATPILIDSEAGTSASWPGIFIETDGLYNLEYCQIKNGGSSLMATATEKANVVIKYNGFSTANTFKNNIVSGSGGYGLVLELGAKDPGIADGTTVYSNNVQGGTIKK